jgi:hypothetical protein
VARAPAGLEYQDSPPVKTKICQGRARRRLHNRVMDPMTSRVGSCVSGLVTPLSTLSPKGVATFGETSTRRHSDPVPHPAAIRTRGGSFSRPRPIPRPDSRDGPCARSEGCLPTMNATETSWWPTLGPAGSRPALAPTGCADGPSGWTAGRDREVGSPSSLLCPYKPVDERGFSGADGQKPERAQRSRVLWTREADHPDLRRHEPDPAHRHRTRPTRSGDRELVEG